MPDKLFSLTFLERALASGHLVPYFHTIANGREMRYEVEGRLAIAKPALTLPELERFAPGSTTLALGFDQALCVAVFKRLGIWRKSYCGIKVAVEVPLHLVTMGMVSLTDQLCDQFDTHRVLFKQFTILLSPEEHLFWQDKQTLYNLRCLTHLGIQLALGNFTEWSDRAKMMQTLDRAGVTVQYLKLGAKLVRQLAAGNLAAREETRVVVKLAKELGSTVEAAGVTDHSSVLALERLEISARQGPWVGLPRVIELEDSGLRSLYAHHFVLPSGDSQAASRTII